MHFTWIVQRLPVGLRPRHILNLVTFFALLLIRVSSVIGAPTSVTLTWTAPGDDGHDGTATTYDLRYSKTVISDANWGAATQTTTEPRPMVAGTIQSCMVTGLVPSSTYYFCLKTVDDKGNISTLSNQAMIATCGGGCIGVVGNCDCSPDGNIDIVDLAVLMSHLFMSDTSCWCIYEANLDNSPPNASGPTIDITDLTMMIDYLFKTFTPLQTCR